MPKVRKFGDGLKKVLLINMRDETIGRVKDLFKELVGSLQNSRAETFDSGFVEGLLEKSAAESPGRTSMRGTVLR
jgi:hypothetical protein